ncbi:restriction endonuclease [Stenotrophomonas pictorum]|nr:restriction endonuclease [Stenotrophomonas pictorum]
MLMFSWILALVLALVLWGLAVLYLWLVRRRKIEANHGLAALAGMRWREFSRIVRDAMAEQRSMQDAIAEEASDAGTSSDFLMTRNGERWLVSCKHGRAYRIGAGAINELGAALRLTGARGAVLITEGHVERDGLAAAAEQSIEVVDDRNLWQMLKSYVPEGMLQSVVGIARREAIRHTGIAALAALTLGLLAGMGYNTVHNDAGPAPAAPVIAAAGNTPAAATVARADTPAADVVPEPSAGMPAEDLLEDPDPETLLRYQQSVSKALARTPGVISGIWLTRLTLSVERSADDKTVWPLICREVERYPALRTVRIQLNPRPGVDEPVRWRQCSTI